MSKENHKAWKKFVPLTWTFIEDTIQDIAVINSKQNEVTLEIHHKHNHTYYTLTCKYCRSDNIENKYIDDTHLASALEPSRFPELKRRS